MFSAPLFALLGRETSLGDSALLTEGRGNQEKDGEGEKRRRQEEIKREKRGK